MHPDLLPAILARGALLNELEALAAALSPEQWAALTENPGWSCHDLLAHLATGDWVMQRLVRDALAGRDLSWWWHGIDLDGGNAERVAAGRSRTADELLADLRAQQTDSLALWELLEERHLQTIMPHWRGGFWTVREYLQGFPEHDRYHIGQLRAAAEARGSEP